MDVSTLDTSTLVPIGAAAGVAVALLVATWKLATAFASLKQAIADLQASIEGHLTRAELEAWADLFRAQNPDLRIPPLRHARR